MARMSKRQRDYLKKHVTYLEDQPKKGSVSTNVNPVEQYIRRGSTGSGGEQFIQTSPYSPEQRAFLDKQLGIGQSRMTEALRQMEQLSQPMSAQDQALNQLQALSSVGATPGSYGGALGQLAGGALGAKIGAIGGPLGAAAGGILGNIGGSMYDRYQAQQAFGPYEEAARRSFERQTVPGIAERFAGQGALGSSAFQGALGQAAADLESQLATAKADYSAQQMEQMMRQKALAGDAMAQQFEREQALKNMRARYLEGLGNQGLWELQQGMQPQWEIAYQGAEPGRMERFATGILPSALQALGTVGGAYFAGPWGASAGGLAGNAAGQGISGGLRTLARQYTALNRMRGR